MLIKPSNKQIGAAYYSKTWLYLGLHMVSHSYFYHLYLILIPSMKLHWYFQCLLSLFLYLTNHFLYFLILAEPYFSSISSFLFVSNQFLTQQTLITHCIPLAHILVKNQNLTTLLWYMVLFLVSKDVLEKFAITYCTLSVLSSPSPVLPNLYLITNDVLSFSAFCS